jgi:flagellin-specific chaperone FliS
MKITSYIKNDLNAGKISDLISVCQGILGVIHRMDKALSEVSVENLSSKFVSSQISIASLRDLLSQVAKISEDSFRVYAFAQSALSKINSFNDVNNIELTGLRTLLSRLRSASRSISTWESDALVIVHGYEDKASVALTSIRNAVKGCFDTFVEINKSVRLIKDLESEWQSLRLPENMQEIT